MEKEIKAYQEAKLKFDRARAEIVNARTELLQKLPEFDNQKTYVYVTDKYKISINRFCLFPEITITKNRRW